MLKSLTLICLLIPCIGYSQSLDSLNQRILSIEQEQSDIKMNLRAHSKQFSLGTVLLLTGAGIVAMDLLTADENKSDNTLKFVGGGAFVLGMVVQIDSHKWIGRAGKRKRARR